MKLPIFQIYNVNSALKYLSKKNGFSFNTLLRVARYSNSFENFILPIESARKNLLSQYVDGNGKILDPAKETEFQTELTKFSKTEEDIPECTPQLTVDDLSPVKLAPIHVTFLLGNLIGPLEQSDSTQNIPFSSDQERSLFRSSCAALSSVEMDPKSTLFGYCLEVCNQLRWDMDYPIQFRGNITKSDLDKIPNLTPENISGLFPVLENADG